MSDRIEDGGPAFPARPTETLTSGATITSHHGMTLRDWFAGQALAGFSSTLSELEDVHWSKLASDAYIAADAMLAARKGGAE